MIHMILHRMDLFFSISLIVSLLLPWIMYYRYWPRIPDRFIYIQRKNEQHFYISKKVLLIILGSITFGIFALILLKIPLQPLSLDAEIKIIGNIILLKSLLLWISLFTTFSLWRRLYCVVTGDISRLQRDYDLIIEIYEGILLPAYLYF